MVEVGNFKFIETKIPDLYIVDQRYLEMLEDILWKVIINNILMKLD